MNLKSFKINNHSYLWVVAFICSLFFINAWQLELFASAVLFVGVWAVITLKQNVALGLALPKSWCLFIMAAFWGLVLVSVIGSDIVNISVMAFCFFSALPLSFLVLATTAPRQTYELIGKILMAVFAVLALWAIIQFLFLNEYFGGRAHHPLMNPNSLAALFSLAFFSGLGGIFYAQEKTPKIIMSAFTVLIFAGIVATGSRGAFFAMIPFVGILLWSFRGIVKRDWKYIASVFGLFALVFVLSHLGLETKENLIVRVADVAGKGGQNIDNNRFALWGATWEMIKVYGIFGTGIGTYFQYFPEFRLPSDRFGTYFAHNDPLQYWVELGILGPVLFYGFAIAVAGRTIQTVRRASDARQKILILAPFCAVAACVLHTHVTFNFYNLSILFALGFLLAVWFWATQQVLQTPSKEVKFKTTTNVSVQWGLVAVPFIMIIGIFMAYMISEHYTTKARNALVAGDLESFADDIMFANKISLQGNYRSYLLAVNLPLSLLEERADELSQEQRQDIFDQGLSYLRHVRFINPRSSSALYYLAKIQQLVPAEMVPEDLESPEEYYRQALKLDPLHIGARIELSKIYEAQGDTKRAIAVIEQGANYKYSTMKALDLYQRQVALYVMNGEVVRAKATMEKMADFSKLIANSQKRLDKGIWGD